MWVCGKWACGKWLCGEWLCGEWLCGEWGDRGPVALKGVARGEDAVRAVAEEVSWLQALVLDPVTYRLPCACGA